MPTLGPTLGPSLGPSPSFGAAAATIYDQVTAGTVNTFIQAHLSSVDDFTPGGLWTFNDTGNDQLAPDYGGGGYDMDAGGGSSLVASPHGKAAPQTGGSGGYWVTSDPTALEVTTVAFAFAARVKFTAKPAGLAGWLARGALASAHYRLTIDASGFPAMAAKQAGAETVASVASDVTDSAWRWVLGGRTVTNELLWVHLFDGGATAAFVAAKDLTNGAALFGLWDGSSAGGVTCQVDHLIAWTGAAAENVYTHRNNLLFEDGTPS